MENPNVTENILPVLALRGLVMMDTVSMSFDVGREASIKALKQSLATNQKIFLVAQKDLLIEKPKVKDLYSYGVVASISQMIKSKNGDMRVQVQGEYRAKLVDVIEEEPFITAVLERKPISKKLGVNALEAEALVRALKVTFEHYSIHLPKIPNENMSSIMVKEDPYEFFYELIKYCILRPEDKQKILECNTIGSRLKTLLKILDHECEVLEIEKDIYDRVKSQMDQNQKEYFLREQMKIIQAELGDGEEEVQSEYFQKIQAIKNISDTSRTKLLEEVKRLERMPMNSQEANVIRSYLDVCLSLPFDTFTKDVLDVNKARKILDKDHFGLKKVKEILMYNQKNILENIKIINDTYRTIRFIDTYCKFDKVFLIVLYSQEITCFIDCENIDIEIYHINEEKTIKITILNGIYHMRDKQIILKQLDTKYDYGSCGHGSNAIQLLVDYAKKINVKRISGDLNPGSKEDYEKLKKFYKINGFNIKDSKFYRNI